MRPSFGRLNPRPNSHTLPLLVLMLLFCGAKFIPKQFEDPLFKAMLYIGIFIEPAVLLIAAKKEFHRRPRFQWTIPEMLSVSLALLPTFYFATHAKGLISSSVPVIAGLCLLYQVSGAVYVWSCTPLSRSKNEDAWPAAASIVIGAWVNLLIGAMLIALFDSAPK